MGYFEAIWFHPPDGSGNGSTMVNQSNEDPPENENDEHQREATGDLTGLQSGGVEVIEPDDFFDDVFTVAE